MTLTLYGKQTHKEAQKILCENENPVEKAYNFYVATMQSIDAVGYMNFNQSWSYSKNVTRRGMAQDVSRWLKNIDENLPDAIEFFRELQVTKDDAVKCIKKLYEDEFTVEQHRKLVDILIRIKGKAIVSGYENEIYNRLLQNGWDKKISELSISTTTSSCDDNPIRKEIIWFKK